MTETEIRLWNRLKRKQINDLRFYRQRPIGKYIVDFFCPTRKIILEIDGGQHYEKTGEEKDIKRDEFMKEQGYTVLRFTNLEVYKNIEGVMEAIAEATKSPFIPL